MNTLDKIVFQKKEELKVRKELVPDQDLMDSALFSQPTISLVDRLTMPGANGIIAEFKRKSPSLGWIHEFADVEKITSGYAAGGASGLSVLTDHIFFGGSTEDLVTARECKLPILRKDFIIDPYQVLATRAMGADVILLIAACLTPGQTNMLAGLAKDLGMEVLLEIHDETELNHVCSYVDLVGVNNRDLKTFTSDINISLRLASKIPADKIKIAESGIHSIDTVHRLRQAGFSGFLMGEYFMKQTNPGTALANFITTLNA